MLTVTRECCTQKHAHTSTHTLQALCTHNHHPPTHTTRMRGWVVAGAEYTHPLHARLLSEYGEQTNFKKKSSSSKKKEGISCRMIPKNKKSTRPHHARPLSRLIRRHQERGLLLPNEIMIPKKRRGKNNKRKKKERRTTVGPPFNLYHSGAPKRRRRKKDKKGKKITTAGPSCRPAYDLHRNSCNGAPSLPQSKFRDAVSAGGS